MASPAYQRREAHEDGFDVPAALEAKERPPVVEQVEFDVAATPAELRGAVGVRPPRLAPALHQRRIRGQERVAHGLDESGLLPPAQVIEEHAADPSLRIAVRKKEVLPRPRREAGVAVGTAGLLEHAV